MTLGREDQVVVDTSVVSILSRPRGPRHSFYSDTLYGQQLLVSFQTLEERWYGAHYRNWGDERMEELEAHLNRFDVVWPNPTLIGICTRLRSDTRKAGNELSTADAWIAATAMMLECPLAADNSDFRHVEHILGIELISYPR